MARLSVGTEVADSIKVQNLSDKIRVQLESVYHDILQQPVPDRFFDLLKNLDSSGSQQHRLKNVAVEVSANDVWSEINLRLGLARIGLAEHLENTTRVLSEIESYGDRIDRLNAENAAILVSMTERVGN